LKVKRAKSISTLKSVLKLEMDELILRKSSLASQEEGFAKDENALLEELTREEGQQKDDIFWYQTFSKFKDSIDIKLKTIRYARQILQAEIEKLTVQILGLHIEQKKYDKIQELDEQKRLKELQRIAQKDLDKVGIMMKSLEQ